MAVMNPHSQELGKKLCEALGLPKNTVWFELRCAVDEIVTVKCAYHPETGSGEPLDVVLAEYELVKRPEPFEVRRPVMQALVDEAIKQSNADLIDRLRREGALR